MAIESKQYLWVSRSGQKAGPFTAGECEQMLHDGRLTPGDFGWCEGMPVWRPLPELLRPLRPAQAVSVGQISKVEPTDNFDGSEESIGVVLGQMGCGCAVWIFVLIVAVSGGVIFPFLLLLLPFALIGGLVDLIRKIGRLARRKP